MTRASLTNEGSLTMEEKEKKSSDPVLRAQNEEQWELAQSDDNRWYAGERLGHSPNGCEAFIHFALNSSGAANFRRQHPQQF